LEDTKLAKDKLYNEGLALVIVKEGRVLFASKERGIKPMYEAVIKLGGEFEGASLADKVIGKAAALLCQLARVKEVYTRLISLKAIEVLEESNIKYQYQESCPYILNRKKTGMCPVEKMSQNINSGEVLLPEIEKFLKGINDKGNLSG